MAAIGKILTITNDSLIHIRHRRSTTGNSTSSQGFLDNPDNVAMFIVLPAIVFVYGGCVCIYCVHKCKTFVAEKQPVRRVKRTIFKVLGRPVTPEEISDVENGSNGSVYAEQSRPQARRQYGKTRNGQSYNKTTAKKEEEIHEVLEDLDSNRSTPNGCIVNLNSDADSGCLSDGINCRSDGDKDALMSSSSRGSMEYNNANKKLSLTSVGIQTEDVIILHRRNSFLFKAQEKKTRTHTKGPPHHRFSDVGARYLSWIDSPRKKKNIISSKRNAVTMQRSVCRGLDNRKVETHKNFMTSTRSSSSTVSPVNENLSFENFSFDQSDLNHRDITNLCFKPNKTYQEIHDHKATLKRSKESKF